MGKAKGLGSMRSCRYSLAVLAPKLAPGSYYQKHCFSSVRWTRFDTPNPIFVSIRFFTLSYLVVRSLAEVTFPKSSSSLSTLERQGRYIGDVNGNCTHGVETSVTRYR
jgi:hypothetical protein